MGDISDEGRQVWMRIRLGDVLRTENPDEEMNGSWQCIGITRNRGKSEHEGRTGWIVISPALEI